MPTRKLRNIIRNFGENLPTEEILHLRTIISKSTDISNVPAARGHARLVQLANLNLLRAFDRLCRENDIKYFMIGGTIIGKIRHNGFIPWDDDIDIGLMEKDWYKLIEIIKIKLPNDDFDISFGTHWNLFKIIHKKTNLFIDIFRFNHLPEDIDYSKHTEIYKSRKQEYYRECYANKIILNDKNTIVITHDDPQGQRDIKWNIINNLIKKQEEIFNRTITKNMPADENGGIMHFSSISKESEFFKNNTIFPIKHMEFEGTLLPFPNFIEDYAFLVWGDIWNFPKCFIQSGHSNDLPGPDTYFNIKSLAYSDVDTLYNAIKG